MTLIGNVPPPDLGVRSTPEQNYAAALPAMQEGGGHTLVLTWARTTTTGIAPEKVRALARAARDFNARGGHLPARSAPRIPL
jgi:hypothetical protein